jgi:transcriptional regulator with XRE-family HTH domain
LSTEYERARLWRTGRRITKILLSEKTGFSVTSIDAFEKGESRTGAPVEPKAFKRYRLCCAAVGAGIDKSFDW